MNTPTQPLGAPLLAPVLILALTLVAALALVGSLSAKAPQPLAEVPGRPQAPDFDLKDPQGKPIRLADFSRKPLIVNFWATWCPPCREEMPSLQRAYQTLAKEGIGLVAINVGEDADTIARYLSAERLDLPAPMDESSQVAASYPMRGLPTTFVIDPQGRLAYVATGGREWDHPDLLAQVRALRD